MESSLSSDYFNLAQIPTDQREHEYHRSVQTQSLGFEPLQMSASQLYNPWSSGSENSAAFRSNPASESMASLQHPGYSSPWCATSLAPLECSPKSRAIGPENSHLSSLYSNPHHSIPSIGLLRDRMSQSNLRASKLPHSGDLLDWPSDPATSFYFARDSYYCHSAQMETSEGIALALRATPPSPPISIFSKQSSSSMSINSMGPTASNTVADSNSPRTSLGDQSEGDHNGEPYSKLIYRALKDADGHRLSLQQIYDWFIKNTSKGRDSTKGWQNSIRHNLSMNKVRPLTPNTSIIPAAGFISNQFHITIHFPGFEASKIDGCTRKKPQNLWALTQDAINRGYVESTTRYRKSNHRKATSSNFPFLGRQRSGSKGGEGRKTCDEDAPPNSARAFTNAKSDPATSAPAIG
ncbi:hypothetical protein N7476_008326 [Penicillium atrosanguineum]|uniref:Fork-head domain-containing protein n=1 Tax=Penicillium atrosanguineum TaxID=1132637 RepID=A0A9W9U2H3_9EURO|nr:hypothetical protein N7476_008326 [Penicillium atrosanguineum]